MRDSIKNDQFFESIFQRVFYVFAVGVMKARVGYIPSISKKFGAFLLQLYRQATTSDKNTQVSVWLMLSVVEDQKFRPYSLSYGLQRASQ